MSRVPALRRRPWPSFAWLREAAWLDGGRLLVYARVFLLVTVAAAAARLSGIYPSDYLGFWAAGHLALAGRPAAAYDVSAHFAVIRNVVPAAGDVPFFYPPVFLLLCAPLALLPYYWSMAVFLGGSVLAYWQAMRALLPRAAAVLLGFPGVTVAVLTAQNGLLTTALFGGGLALLGRAPALGGVCFGCLCYKPQLGLTVPLALLAARQYRAAAAAAATVAALAALSLALFGAAAWRGFLADLPFAHDLLENGSIAPGLWVSAYRLLLQLGAGQGAAALAQGVLGVAACAALVLGVRRRPDTITGLLPVTTMLATPYLLNYDLVLLAVPMAWVAAAARRGGALPWERAGLGFVYVAPLLALLADALQVPLGPAAMLVMFALVLRRALRLPRA